MSRGRGHPTVKSWLPHQTSESSGVKVTLQSSLASEQSKWALIVMPPPVAGYEMSLEGPASRWDGHAVETITQQMRTVCCSTWVVSLPPKKALVVQNPVPRGPLGTTESHLHVCSGNGIFSSHAVSLTSRETCQKRRETGVPSAADTDPEWPWFPDSQLPPLLLSVAYLLTGWKQNYISLFWAAITQDCRPSGLNRKLSSHTSKR